MDIHINHLLLLFIAILVSACNDPILILPGAMLSGDITPPPEVWAAVPDTIQLETRPSDPYSVNIWAVGIGANLYVATVDANWMQFIAEDPAVRVRIKGKVYALSARKVTDRAELLQISKQYQEKYAVDETDSWVDRGTAYRLERSWTGQAAQKQLKP